MRDLIMTTALASVMSTDLVAVLEAQLPALPPVPELPELPDSYRALQALPQEERLRLMDIILAHYENGVDIYDLADKLQVHNATIYRALKKYRLTEWKEVASARYEAQIEAGERELRTAPDTNAVTRARTRIETARWMLERLDRRNYGQDAPTSAQAVQININLRRETAPE